MNFLRAFKQMLIGSVFGVGTAIILSPALTSIYDVGNMAIILIPFICAIGAVLDLFAPTIRRAFGLGLLLCGVSLLALPLSAMMLSGRVASEVISAAATAKDQVFAAIGAGFGAAAIIGITTVLGLILGGILIVIGLVLALGGRRELVVIEKSTESGNCFDQAHPI
jgi:hypothetical protein